MRCSSSCLRRGAPNGLHLKGVVHHTDKRSQRTSIRFGERLAAEAGIQPSVGAVDSFYDSALAAITFCLDITSRSERANRCQGSSAVLP